MKKNFKNNIRLIALSLILGTSILGCSKHDDVKMAAKANSETLSGSLVNSAILSTEHPLSLNLALLGAKISASWTNPSDLPNNATVTTMINYSGVQNFSFYLPTGTSSHSFSGVPGDAYNVTLTIRYTTINGTSKTATDTKSISIPASAQPDPNSCTAPTAQMSFPEEIEYAAPNGGTLYKQDHQIIVRLPADFAANQLWVIRYKKNEPGSVWQYTSAFPSSGTLINGRRLNFWIINGLDGDYVLELGVSCSGINSNFTNTSYASTIV